MIFIEITLSTVLVKRTISLKNSFIVCTILMLSKMKKSIHIWKLSSKVGNFFKCLSETKQHVKLANSKKCLYFSGFFSQNIIFYFADNFINHSSTWKSLLVNDWQSSGYATKQLGDDAFGQKRSLNLKILASIHH